MWLCSSTFVHKGNILQQLSKPKYDSPQFCSSDLSPQSLSPSQT